MKKKKEKPSASEIVKEHARKLEEKMGVPLNWQANTGMKRLEAVKR